MRNGLFAIALSLGVAGCTAAPELPETASVDDGDPVRIRHDAQQRVALGDRLLVRARRGGGVEAPFVREAIGAFHDALQRDPLLFQAHLRLASCYYLLQQHDLEMSEYRKCLAVNPRCVDAWENLGHSRLALDDLLGAREAYERALDLEPDHEVVLFNLHVVEQDLGEPERAREYYEQFLLAKQRRCPPSLVTHD